MMHPIASSILLGLSVTIALLCGVGVLVMRDAFQRLHFPTPVVSLSAIFLTVAVFLEDKDAGARTKMVLIALIMFVMNGVLSHATARAIRIKKVGHWPVAPEEKMIQHDTGLPATLPTPEQHS